jgi:hypothetical protein
VRRNVAPELENQLTRKHVPASIRENAFNCPHCGAFTAHIWYKVYVDNLGQGTPPIPTKEKLHSILGDIRNRGYDYAQKIDSGLIFLETSTKDHSVWGANNIHFSSCFTCKKISVWVHDKLLFPPELQGEEPNEDLPPDVLLDYQEARSILNLSSRGAAALLRLAIQKLCRHLGESGNNINVDIKSLVKKGLNPVIQKSLDVVRVVGNEAVHPGTLDLRDDRDTASKLFRLVNLIVEQMISGPKHVEAMYEELPESKKKEIEKRDA